MSEEQRQKLKSLIETCIQHPDEVDVYVDKIIELFNMNFQYQADTNRPRSRHSSSVFQDDIAASTSLTNQHSRLSTYNEKGLVNNTRTVLYDNHDID